MGQHFFGRDFSLSFQIDIYELLSLENIFIYYMKKDPPLTLPYLDPEIIKMESIHPIDDMQKKKKEPRQKVWTSQHNMLSFSMPQQNSNPRINRKYKLTFKYNTKDDLKPKSHTVFFGSGNDYIDHLDKDRRQKKINQMSNLKNPFHSNYWTGQLLNKFDTLAQGAMELFNTIKRKTSPPIG